MIRRRPLSIMGRSYDPLAMLVTAIIGIVGALLAKAIGTPLPWLFGSVVSVGLAGYSGVKIAGEPIQFPIETRYLFVPIIGVAIGGTITPDLAGEFPKWWPTLIAVILYVPIAQFTGFWIYRRLGGLSVPTAFFSAMPGGLIEAITLGEENGADARMLGLLQFLRLILCILIVPIVFTLVEGVAVGSASGVQMAGADAPLEFRDVVILTLSGIIGVVLGRKIGLPAAIITGPILVSAAVTLAGLTQASPPGWMIAMTQVVVGVTLGVRFVGMTRQELSLGIRLSFLSVSAMLVLSAVLGVTLHNLVGESIEAVVLAFAPGGVVEMALIALSLQISVVFVAAHHIVRILMTVFFAKFAYSRLYGPHRS